MAVKTPPKRTPKQPSRRGKGPAGTKKQKRGFFRRFWWLFLVVPLTLILGLLGVLFYAYAHIQIPNAAPPPLTTHVYDRHGHLITTLHAEQDRTNIPLSEMPKDLREAVIATEDKGFYHHGAINFFSIFRAAWADITHGSAVQGGSTITQQYVKNAYTGSERTLMRKIKEAMIAVKLEKKFTKNQILEKYLNTIYFGHGAYGVEAAAETYFRVHARQLSVLQSALLAGLIAAPASFDPVAHHSAALSRRNYVLDQMAEENYITQSKATELKSRPIAELAVENPTRKSKAAYFADYVRQWLLNQYGEQLTYTGGLNVTTSLDLGWQKAAEHAVASHLSAKQDPQAALVAIDPRTGQIRAMVGGKLPHVLQNNQNLAAAPSRRQTGSSFKAFTLAAALEQRFSLTQTWNGPPEIVIPDRECYTTDPNTGVYGPWHPSNYGDESAGAMNLVSATANSVNTIFAQIVTKLRNGPSDVVRTAHSMGIDSKLKAVCSITLGTQEVSPLEMTRAYATIADGGLRRDATPVETIKKPDGKVIGGPDLEGTRVMDKNTAAIETYILQGVVQHGTGTAAALSGHEVAGKTGTGQNYTNAWFCGYTPQLTTCVWVGYARGNVPMLNVEGFPVVFGGSLPAEIWHDFMSSALAHAPAVPFPTPDFAAYNAQAIRPSITPPPAPTHSPSPSPSPSKSPKPSPSPSPSPSPLPSPTTTKPPPPPTTTPPVTTPPVTTPATSPPASSPAGTASPLAATSLPEARAGPP